jgi:DNA-binding response OmpR family regulator
MPPRPHILVAEDDQSVRELIRTLLTDAGFDAHTVADGAKALERIGAIRPDAMVLDINMPVVDGFSVLEALKARGLRFPVLVLTARHSGEDVRRAVGLGAKDYLTKPFTKAQLQARVARLLLAVAPAPLLKAALVG